MCVCASDGWSCGYTSMGVLAITCLRVHIVCMCVWYVCVWMDGHVFIHRWVYLRGEVYYGMYVCECMCVSECV